MNASRFLDLFESSVLSAKLDALKPNMAAVAQKVYDEWDEEDIDTYAGGGVCHIVAEDISELLDEHGVISWTHSLDYKQHVVTIAVDKAAKEVFMVDIPEYTYEEGGGFSWTKIPGVRFDESYVDIVALDWDDWIESDPDIDLEDW